jgi:hypothetical protein
MLHFCGFLSNSGNGQQAIPSFVSSTNGRLSSESGLWCLNGKPRTRHVEDIWRFVLRRRAAPGPDWCRSLGAAAGPVAGQVRTPMNAGEFSEAPHQLVSVPIEYNELITNNKAVVIHSQVWITPCPDRIVGCDHSWPNVIGELGAAAPWKTGLSDARPWVRNARRQGLPLLQGPRRALHGVPG